MNVLTEQDFFLIIGNGRYYRARRVAGRMKNRDDRTAQRHFLYRILNDNVDFHGHICFTIPGGRVSLIRSLQALDRVCIELMGDDLEIRVFFLEEPRCSYMIIMSMCED